MTEDHHCPEYDEYKNNMYNDGDPVPDFKYCPYCGTPLEGWKMSV